MYQPMLFVHWKQARLLLIPFVMAAFGLPLLQVQGLGPGPGGEAVTLSAVAIVSSYQIWLPVFPLFAAAVGAMLALTAWNWDHQHQHVYALSLPLARWEYAMLKMGAGVVLLLIPVALLLGLAGLCALLWALRSGQFDDLDGAAVRILIDDEPDGPPDQSDSGSTRLR